MIHISAAALQQLPLSGVDWGVFEIYKPEDVLGTRLKQYDKDHCWQYQIRLDNLKQDLLELPLHVNFQDMKISDFEFKPILGDAYKQEAIQFIKRHEWLGTITQFTTHYFGAYYSDILAGVTTFSVPNSFSKILGEKTKDIERLISRGACISWSPKCLASSFLMWCIRYMVANTPYRLFTAYADPTAKELGTIYQACNFYYMGQKSGTTTRYINPYTGKIVSDRFFRHKTAYRRYASELGILWNKDWMHKNGMNWSAIPDDVEQKLRSYSKYKQSVAEKVEFPNKHKYAYVLGADKRETRELRREFLSRHKVYPYPKQR